jgi:CubicO group peptidase (beta-lactamase class C family)
MQSKAQIDQVLRQKSDAKEIPGVVAMAGNSKEVIYQGAFGKRDLSKDDPMTADSVFWIASMSKAITAAGAMQLVAQGKLSLDAPIGKVLPDLAAPQVLEGFDAKGEPKLRAGLANTYFWIDPSRDVTGVILMQVLPFVDNKCMEAFTGFERGLYAGLDAAQKAA